MKSTELNIIDYALTKTMDKGGAYASLDNIVLALDKYLVHNVPSGITSNGDARNYIMSINQDDIMRELLKNVVKKNFAAIHNSYAVKLGTNKTFDDELGVDDVDILIYDALSSMPMEAVVYILEKNPKVVDSMVKSFVESRYYNPSYTVKKLDDENIVTDECARLLNKIDGYYYEKENGSSKSM